MQLCFDATRFGISLEEAIALAASIDVPALEFSVKPFATGARAGSLTKDEYCRLRAVADLLRRSSVGVRLTNLEIMLDAGSAKSVRSFHSMLRKLATVVEAIECRQVGFYLVRTAAQNWLDMSACAVEEAAEILKNSGASLLLRLSTPPVFQGVSLRQWQPVDLNDVRALLGRVPDLSLSFSAADLIWQGIDYLKSLAFLTAAVRHIEALDLEIVRELLADSGMFGPLWWRYRLPGRGQVDWRQLIETLKLYDYAGTFSVHLEDEFMDASTEGLTAALEQCLGVLAPLVRG